MLKTDFKRINSECERVQANGIKVGVFGLGEGYSLVDAYTTFRELDVVCGCDDNLTKYTHKELPFGLMSLEDAKALGVNEVFLCTNPVYNQKLITRLSAMGILAFPCFSERT
jgi:hypothetical protein